jgi:hypothetical protein
MLFSRRLLNSNDVLSQIETIADLSSNELSHLGLSEDEIMEQIIVPGGAKYMAASDIALVRKFIAQWSDKVCIRIINAFVFLTLKYKFSANTCYWI